jgi:predicted GTPase
VKALLQRILADRALQFYLFLSLSVLLPLLALAALGLIHLWQQGWILWFGLFLLVLASLSTVLRLQMGQASGEDREHPLDSEVEHLPPVPDWSANDRHVWALAQRNITDQALAETEWPDIWEAMQEQLSFVARTYHPDDREARLAFTVPELLLMLETWSREYRAVVLQTVPLIQGIKVSTLVSGSREVNRWKKTYDRYGPLLDLVRIITSKGMTLPGTIASALTSEFGSRLGEHVQRNLKQLLFEQVSQVAIDLYSGRLKLSERELTAYRDARSEPAPVKVRPLTVMLVGQVNAGKSSLVNALSSSCVAETDLLPTTSGFSRYHLTLADGLDIHLVDSPGLDGSEQVSDRLLEQAVNADLLIWVCQATQPAKALDRQLIDRWDAWFDRELGRKKPPLLLVTTHNDLLPPTAAWNPPYDMEDADNPKVGSMLEALDYTSRALGLDPATPAIPVAVTGDGSFNVDTLKEVLLQVSDEARAAQLNRDRIDAANSASVVKRGLKQAGGALRSGYRLLRRRT